jgi:PIN domain nuclease of toxin-antitoxin system
MAFLLDTHVFLWYINGDEVLNEKIKNVINDNSLERYVSIVSLWEISIKMSINKLKLTHDFEALDGYLKANNLKLLSVRFEHLIELKNLPHHYSDPFDRLLIAQASFENLTIISADRHFKAYPVRVTW